jgi:argininosuccinate synthase
LSRDFKRLELQENFDISGFENRISSTDTNLWCREFESGTLDDPERFEIAKDLYQWSVVSETTSRVIELSFDGGRLVAVDAEPVTDLVEMISVLNATVGRYGIGRFSSLEHLEGGEKVLEVREAPAAALILEGFSQLASATVEVETLRWMRILGEALIMEAVEGRWFRGLRRSLQSFLEVSANCVSGDVRFTLRSGGFDLDGYRAASPLYIRDREQWEYRKAADARSVTAGRFDRYPISAGHEVSIGLSPGSGFPGAGLDHLSNGESPLLAHEWCARDIAAQRFSREHRVPAPTEDPTSQASHD